MPAGDPQTQARNASEVAQVLAQSVRALLSDEEQRQLARLIDHSLASPPAAQARGELLGLVLRLIREQGELPTEPRYEAAHADAQLRGESWPTPRSLRRAYGHWLAVQRAAVRELSSGGAARNPRNYLHAFDRPPPGTYSKPEVIWRALIACWQWLEEWPTEWEYHEWAALQRAAARAAGKPLPLYPSAKPIRSTCGDYARALSGAKERAYELGLASR